MIQTFVFFDLETTGLIQGNIMPNITEMSLVAVTRNNLLNTTDDLPRVLHKLLLPVHPKVRVPKMVELFTNLSNENLKDAQYFHREVYNLMQCFLNQLAQPICFVAHNGINFDYPILLDEVKCINEAFSDTILCIDTLHLFKEFFSQNATEKYSNTMKATNSSTSLRCEDLYYLLDDGHDKELIAALDSVMMETCMQTTQASLQSEKQQQSSDKTIHTDCKQEQSSNESGCNKKTPSNKYCSTMQAVNEKTPEAQLIKSDDTHNSSPCRKGKHVKRKLNFMSCQPPNFKLGTLYTHMLGGVAKQLHTAEGDCLSMLCCAIKIASFFVEWADVNAIPLVNYSKK